METVASEAGPQHWRPRRRLWLLLALFMGGSVVLSAAARWRRNPSVTVASTILPSRTSK